MTKTDFKILLDHAEQAGFILRSIIRQDSDKTPAPPYYYLIFSVAKLMAEVIRILKMIEIDMNAKEKQND